MGFIFSKTKKDNLMNFTIRKIKKEDRECVIDMMRAFYASPAVLTNGSEKIFAANIDTAIEGSPYLEGFVFEGDGEILGYGMLAHSFSTEFGKKCVWIEDVYVKESFRGKRIGSGFLEYVSNLYPSALLRLEVEDDNLRAKRVYSSAGYEVMPYVEMVRNKETDI